MDVKNKFLHRSNNISWLIYTQDIILVWTKMRRRIRNKKKRKKKKKQILCICYKWFIFSDSTTRFTQ